MSQEETKTGSTLSETAPQLSLGDDSMTLEFMTRYMRKVVEYFYPTFRGVLKRPVEEFELERGLRYALVRYMERTQQAFGEVTIREAVNFSEAWLLAQRSKDPQATPIMLRRT